MRLFTAFDVPTCLRDDFQRAKSALEGDLDARWAAPDQYHCTVRFLGDVDAERAQSLRAALHDVDASAFTCRPYGLDVLPSRRSPSVLIAGIQRSDPLETLYQQVTDVLDARGLPPEDRDYRPHVTLARLDDAHPEAVHEVLQAHEDLTFPSFDVTEFHLYESTLTADGAIHDVRDTIPLSSSD